jgi:osmotically-inducible protein OsmY
MNDMEDKTLRDDVISALEFDPSVTATNIGVAVKGGVVTLSGFVNSYSEKLEAERCVQRVRGVKAIAEELAVRYPSDKQTADDQIAHRILSILNWTWDVPKDSIKVKVENGIVTLTGQVRWNYQRLAANAAVHKLTGVVAVINQITITPHASAPDIKAKIMAAFKRDAELEGNQINVYVDNDKVRLEGSVKAWRERRLAEDAAWSVPGVKMVEDNLHLS